MNDQSRAEGVAVVTGAAGSMGKATAQALFDAGWNDLLLCDLGQEALDAVAGPLRQEGANVAVFAADDSLRSCLDVTLPTLGLDTP
jgi:NAD(P)-dependent dehydrogenase (short-subunit alcohol dehydrogenase family)